MLIFKSFPENTVTLKTYQLPANLEDAPRLLANYQGGRTLSFQNTEKNRRYRIHKTSLQHYSRQLFNHTVKIDLAGVEEPLTGAVALSVRFGTYNLFASGTNPPDSIYIKAFPNILGLRLAALPLRGMSNTEKIATLDTFQKLGNFSFATGTLPELRSLLLEILENYNLLLHLNDLGNKYQGKAFHFNVTDLTGPITPEQQDAFTHIKSLFA